MSKRKDGTHTGNQTIHVRMPISNIETLVLGIKLSGLGQSEFVREAINREVERLKKIENE